MTTAENIKTQLRKLIADRPAVSFDLLYLYHPVFNHVHEILSEEEVMSGYCIGSLMRNGKGTKTGKWLIVCTNQQLVFMHKGLISGLTHFEIPLADITDITSKLRWFNSYIKIRDKATEWELYQLNKTDLRFFELALGNAIAALKK